MNPMVVMVSSQVRMKRTRPLYGSPKSRETDLAHRGAFIQFVQGGSFKLWCLSCSVWPSGPTPAGSREVKSWIMVVMNRSHALGSFAAVATSDHTVIMSCLQGCRITLRLALRSVQTGVLIQILLDLSATVLWRLETHSASNSALRPRRNQLRCGTLPTSLASGDFRAHGRDSVLACQFPS